MPSLATRTIEDAGASRKLENVDQPGDFASVAAEIKDRLVFEKVAGIKKGRPPVIRNVAQKKTGSR